MGKRLLKKMIKMSIRLTIRELKAIDLSTLNKEELEKHCNRLLVLITKLEKQR
jgi:hypothetical protein